MGGNGQRISLCAYCGQPMTHRSFKRLKIGDPNAAPAFCRITHFQCQHRRIALLRYAKITKTGNLALHAVDGFI